MIKRRLVLGLAPTRRDYFINDIVKRNRDDICRKTEAFSKELDFDLVGISGVNDEDMMSTLAHAKKIAELFKAKGVNALFIPHCNFGQEETVLYLAKALNVPVLIWGQRDEAPVNFAWRDTDTQCGLFATGKALYRGGIPFTYIENCFIDEEPFAKGFREFIVTARIVNQFRDMKIAQISVRPQPFLSVMVNESELFERFNINVVPIPATVIVRDALEISKTNDVLAVIEGYKTAGVDLSKMDDESVRKMAALELAIERFAEENECNAVVSECWNVFGIGLGIKPCAVFGNLTDKGLPVCCENDIHGAISMLIAQAANNAVEPAFLADLTQRHPTNDNAELLWHCGPFPKSLKASNSHAFVNEGMGQWRLKDGDLTLIRFDGCRGTYNLLAGEGKTTDGPLTNGNYVWVEVDNWVRWEKKLVCGPYIHHTACVYGKYATAIEEACKYINGVNFDRP